jgi:hypothetical protein
MKLRGTLSVLMIGSLVSVLTVGAALASQEEGDGGKNKAADKGKANAENGNGKSQALEVEGRPTPVNGYVDLSQQGVTPGDLFIFSDELYETANSQGDGQNSSEKIGQADGRCTLIDPETERLMCTVVSSFENGTIVTEGILTNDESAPNTASVTGGTGEYRGATGEASLDLSPVEGPHAIQFDLQRKGSASQPDREETGQEEDTQAKTEVKADNRGNQENTNRDSAGKAKG